MRSAWAAGRTRGLAEQHTATHNTTNPTSQKEAQILTFGRSAFLLVFNFAFFALCLLGMNHVTGSVGHGALGAALSFASLVGWLGHAQQGHVQQGHAPAAAQQAGRPMQPHHLHHPGVHPGQAGARPATLAAHPLGHPPGQPARHAPVARAPGPGVAAAHSAVAHQAYVAQGAPGNGEAQKAKLTAVAAAAAAEKQYKDQDQRLEEEEKQNKAEHDIFVCPVLSWA